MILKYEHSLVVCKTGGGKYKVYVMGRADGHVIDWRGCNFKFVPVTGQPFRGYPTKEDADQLMKSYDENPARLVLENDRAKKMSGQSIPDERVC